MGGQTAEPAVRARQSAEQQRARILDAAVDEFRRAGLHGGSTRAIAEHAGVSQAYVFVLFGTKKALFLAACEYAVRRAGHDLGSKPDTKLLLHLLAACSDDEIRASAAAMMRSLVGAANEQMGLTAREALLYIAAGLCSASIEVAGADRSDFC